MALFWFSILLLFYCILLLLTYGQSQFDAAPQNRIDRQQQQQQSLNEAILKSNILNSTYLTLPEQLKLAHVILFKNNNNIENDENTLFVVDSSRENRELQLNIEAFLNNIHKYQRMKLLGINFYNVDRICLQFSKLIHYQLFYSGIGNILSIQQILIGIAERLGIINNLSLKLNLPEPKFWPSISQTLAISQQNNYNFPLNASALKVRNLQLSIKEVYDDSEDFEDYQFEFVKNEKLYIGFKSFLNYFVNNETLKLLEADLTETTCGILNLLKVKEFVKVYFKSSSANVKFAAAEICKVKSIKGNPITLFVDYVGSPDELFDSSIIEFYTKSKLHIQYSKPIKELQYLLEDGSLELFHLNRRQSTLRHKTNKGIISEYYHYYYLKPIAPISVKKSKLITRAEFVHRLSSFPLFPVSEIQINFSEHNYGDPILIANILIEGMTTKESMFYKLENLQFKWFIPQNDLLFGLCLNVETNELRSNSRMRLLFKEEEPVVEYNIGRDEFLLLQRPLFPILSGLLKCDFQVERTFVWSTENDEFFTDYDADYFRRGDKDIDFAKLNLVLTDALFQIDFIPRNLPQQFAKIKIQNLICETEDNNNLHLFLNNRNLIHSLKQWKKRIFNSQIETLQIQFIPKYLTSSILEGAGSFVKQIQFTGFFDFSKFLKTFSINDNILLLNKKGIGNNYYSPFFLFTHLNLEIDEELQNILNYNQVLANEVKSYLNNSNSRLNLISFTYNISPETLVGWFSNQSEYNRFNHCQCFSIDCISSLLKLTNKEETLTRIYCEIIELSITITDITKFDMLQASPLYGVGIDTANAANKLNDGSTDYHHYYHNVATILENPTLIEIKQICSQISSIGIRTTVDHFDCPRRYVVEPS